MDSRKGFKFNNILSEKYQNIFMELLSTLGMEADGAKYGFPSNIGQRQDSNDSVPFTVLLLVTKMHGLVV